VGRCQRVIRRNFALKWPGPATSHRLLFGSFERVTRCPEIAIRAGSVSPSNPLCLNPMACNEGFGNLKAVRRTCIRQKRIPAEALGEIGFGCTPFLPGWLLAPPEKALGGRANRHLCHLTGAAEGFDKPDHWPNVHHTGVNRDSHHCPHRNH
jgi:hypothetical protein